MRGLRPHPRPKEISPPGRCHEVTDLCPLETRLFVLFLSEISINCREIVPLARSSRARTLLARLKLFPDIERPASRIYCRRAKLLLYTQQPVVLLDALRT